MKPPVPREVTFRKVHRDFLERIGQEHTWEHSGGHNLCVPAERLLDVLLQLDGQNFGEARRTTSPEVYVRTQAIVDIHNESQLQSRLETKWQDRILEANHTLHSRTRVDNFIPDIVVYSASIGVVIVELKYTHAGGVELDQLQKYLRLPSLRAKAAAGRLFGVLVARDVNSELIRQANLEGSGIALYAFGQTNGQLLLHRIAGSSTLDLALLAP